MRRRTLLAGGAATGLGLMSWGTAQADPIGSGWTEIFPEHSLHQPPGRTRHTLSAGEHHFWLYATDPSTFPGQDSGPRSELRFHNDYTRGQAQSNSLNYYDTNQVIYSPVYDTYLRLNVVHDTVARKVHVFVNRQFRATFADHGAATHYFKCGLYGREGMSDRCDAYLRNIRIYRK